MDSELLRASRRLSAGTVIFRQDEMGDEMFVILSGGVSLRLGDERELAVLGPGEFFGELALLGDAPRTATAIAVEETILLGVRRETFVLMMQDDLSVVYRMLDALGRRLAATDRQMHEITECARTVRLGAHVLSACLACREPSLTIDLAVVAESAKMSVQDAEGLVRTLVARGIGQIDGGRWRLDPAADAPRLASALATAL